MERIAEIGASIVIKGDLTADENIVIAPGCKLALFMAMMALIDPGDEVLYPDPGFPGYESITLGLGGKPVPFILAAKNHLQPDPDEIEASITPRTKILITNSPGNPTGTVYTDDVQRRLAELAVKHDLLVLSDEIYARIIYGGTYKSMMSYPGMEERTLIIDGFSKSFAMTGWRLGYAKCEHDREKGTLDFLRGVLTLAIPAERA